MKNIQLATLTICILLGAVSASLAQRNTSVRGNGKLIEKTISVSEYDRINVVGSMKVVLSSGAEGNIQVLAEENIQEHIVVETKGDQLTVRIENGVSINPRKEIEVRVPFQQISSVSLTGSGDIIANDEIKADQFETSIVGSGEIALPLAARTVDAKVTGSGEMELSGKVTALELKLSGSGNFKGANLHSESAQAYISGSGDASVYAKGSLKARVNGSGDIRYGGNPTQHDTKVLGSGSIKSM
ncbi:MAG: DUF2807 domain-containing protein [Flavobacteriaceae bacterium]|nr:DUF2807 domain-containing protein [Flavobacteriaceae bacterium]